MSIEFTINEKLYSVKLDDFEADVTLNTFIREKANLFGTKFYCLQGGCGVCTVTVRCHHPVTRRYYSRSVNSCLVLLNLCHGWDIVTIEGLGDRKVGYHPLQERLAHFNGTQCGFCSPGMIMNMYSNLEANDGKLSAAQIENSFGGNLCRCTGYRPILDTMKSFAADAEYTFFDLCGDIEDMKICPKIGKVCEQSCRAPKQLKSADHRIWYHPNALSVLLYILESIRNSKYMLVGGNTGQGIYPRDPNIEIFIDVNNVPELRAYHIGDRLELGGSVTIAEMMDILSEASKTQGFEYCSLILKHLKLVAHEHVRNVATIAGNLMLIHDHPDFASDLCLLFSSVDAAVVLKRIYGAPVDEELSVQDFLCADMNGTVVEKICMPRLDKRTTIFGSYKVTPRAQNAHAYVNAAFLLKFNGSAVDSCNICFGGVSPGFRKSIAAAEFLHGRDPFSSDTLAGVLNVLDSELDPTWNLPAPSPEYRRKVALGLFYRYIIKYSPKGLVKERYLSGGYTLERPLSSGTQVFDTKKELWPVNKPVRKLEAIWQCSGEAKFVNDLPPQNNEAWAAFVPATRVHATVVRIDPSEALTMPGIIAFYSAKDVPGLNSFVTLSAFGIMEPEEIFCSSTVKYHSQPVGIILAKSNQLANEAAKKVKILYEYGDEETKVTPTLEEALRYKRKPPHAESIEEAEDGTEAPKNKSIWGRFDMLGQFHFSMESHTTICIPREDGILVYPASHYLDLVQTAIANALSLKQNQVDIEIRRLGGSFGCKISRSNHSAVACAVGSWLSNRPVRFVQTIESNMKSIGKRSGCVCDYIASANEQGKLQSFSMNFYADMGCSNNESFGELFTTPSLRNCYETPTQWNVNGNDVLTDAPSHSWCRAPGTMEGISMIENVMEHIARAVGKDPVDVRMSNIPKNSIMKKLLPDFVDSTEYRERKKKINAFNINNRWRKRGIGLSLMRYGIFYFGNMAALVAIFHQDGTVAVTHGGVEMGQGINTKAAQVAAYTLGIPLELVTVKATELLVGANSTVTGGSVASETVCLAVQKACKELLSRMKPVREKLKNPTWVQVVQQAHLENVNLVSRKVHKVGDMEGYNVWGLACSEIEVDILTGSFQLNRVDILEDTGESLNPLIDVGQIEGAFIMGIGFWLTERLVYNRQTGELLTADTWHYKVPGAKDIPIDFRIKLDQKRPNPKGFLRSKATGEMGICLSVSALFALRHALDSAREDVGLKEWYHLGAPTTIEEIVLAAGHTKFDFKLS